MRSVGKLSSPDEDWLVLLSAGMPGGVGNTGHECGAVTSSLVLLGLAGIAIYLMLDLLSRQLLRRWHDGGGPHD
jgi:hypothetical protein